MKYLSLKGIVVLAVAIAPIVLKLKLKKKVVTKPQYPSVLAEAV